MPNRFASALLLSAFLAAASAAWAQAPAATAVAPITVEAAAKPKVVEKQAFNFVQGYAASANPELDQIARWRDAVCVQVIGLPDEQGALVKARIGDVAAAVGLSKPRSGCNTNVQIVFTAHPQETLDAVYKRREQILGYDHRAGGKRLKTVTRPIQAWYVTATLGESGTPTDPPASREVIDDPDNHSPMGCGMNHVFTACLQTVFKNVLVVADTRALDGKDLGVLADYLAMVTLSQPKSLDGCTPLASVIDVLAKASCPGRATPDGLTSGDAAYLTALYQADPQARKASAQTDIALRMTRILTRAGSGGR